MQLARVPAESAAAARPPLRTRGHVKTYEQGRTCAEAECETTLSRYNEETRCWAHAARADGVRQRP